MARVPAGQRDRSIRSVISSTWASSRSSVPLAVIAGTHQAFGDGNTGGSDGCGEVVTDREPNASGPACVDEPVGERGGVGAGDDLVSVRVDRQLRERQVEDLDVIGCRVRTGVAGP